VQQVNVYLVISTVPFTLFYRRGEAVVMQGDKEVNRLFKADFFGERALLSNEPRGATVSAVQDTVCLTLDRDTFVELLGPFDAVMKVGRVEGVGIPGGRRVKRGFGC